MRGQGDNHICDPNMAENWPSTVTKSCYSPSAPLTMASVRMSLYHSVWLYSKCLFCVVMYECVCFIVTSMRQRGRQDPKSAELLCLSPPLNSANQHIFLFVTDVLWETDPPSHLTVCVCVSDSLNTAYSVWDTDPTQTCLQEVWTASVCFSIISAARTPTQ